MTVVGAFEGEAKSKTQAVARKPTKKKPKNKPKRPLSAYNFFFKEEREKILKVASSEDPVAAQADPESEDYIPEEQIKRLKKEGGKISFEEMGKLIGTRWKNIDPDRLTKFSELAAEDTERYKKEMVTFTSQQEAKARREASKQAANFAENQMRSYPESPYPMQHPMGYPPAAYGMSEYGYGGVPMYGYPYMGGTGSQDGQMSGSNQYENAQQPYGMVAPMYGAMQHPYNQGVPMPYNR